MGGEGSASIRAMQIGGDPVKLGGVFSKDKNGHYHVVHCSLNAMDQCVNAAGGLLDYVSKSLPTQASFEGGTGLVPLGLQHVQYKKIERIGLKAPTSFVTRAVCMARAELAKELEANEYYADKLHQLIHKYPVKWDESSATYKALEPLYERAMRNIAILDGDDGVMGCFNSPEECLALAAKATSQLKSITQEELETLSAIKHSYQYKGGLHYGDISFFHFDGAQYTADQSPDRTDPSRVEVKVDAKKCLIDVADHSRCGGGAACLRVVLQFGRTQSNFDQSGLTCTFPGGIGTVTRQTSPFHIEPFNMSLDSRDIDCERLPMPGASTQYDTEL